MDIQKRLQGIIGMALIIGAIVLGIWLPLRVMLYGGIMQAIDNWGVNNSAVVWGIIRAVFFELGFILAWIVGVVGVSIVKE